MCGLSCVAGERGAGGGGANSFVTVEGRGVGVTESGDIWYDVGSAGSIRVTARSGWLVNGRESVTLDPSSGTVGGIDVTSRLQEDSQHIHVFPCVTDNAHARDVVTRTATAKIDPAPMSVTYNWTRCGRCGFLGVRDGVDVTYGANDETGASGSYLEEPLTVSATVRNGGGQLASATCTTNFTVVAVDVSVDGAGEGTEETSPPSVIYSRKLTRFAIDNMMPVKIICKPKNLPDTELVRLTLSGGIELYEMNESGVPSWARTCFSWNEIGGKTFGLLGQPLLGGGTSEGASVTAEHYDSGAKDLAKVKVVPPLPLLITNVQFLSPSSKNKGAWPYDSVWDDDDWELTVDGSLAEYCATDTDDATVKYTLSRDAKRVDVDFWKYVFPFDRHLYSIKGAVNTGGKQEEIWAMPANLGDGQYYAKVIALESETDEERKAKSNDGKVVRECYYRSNASDDMIIWETCLTDAEVESLNKGLGGALAVDIAALKLPWQWAAIIIVAQHSGVVGVDIPKWFTSGTEIKQYTWAVTKFEWDGEKYTVPQPMTWVDPGEKGEIWMEFSEFEMRYVKIGRPCGKDSKLRIDWQSWFHCGEVVLCGNGLHWELTVEGFSTARYPEDSIEWKWEPKPKEGHGLRCPKCCKDEQSKE